MKLTNHQQPLWLTLLTLTLAIALAACAPSPAQPAAANPTVDQPAAVQALLVEPAQPTAADPAPTTAAQPQSTQASAACSNPATLTPALTEGPYFKAGSPERSSLLETGTPGIKLVLTGKVLDASCQPVAGALIEFWQADANGQYDNSGYTMRGHQFSAADGAYQLTTVVPGLYTGRTEHIHVKVQAPNGPMLTTQLFFPGVTQNDSDGIYNAALLMNIQKGADGQLASYDFVINTK